MALGSGTAGSSEGVQLPGAPLHTLTFGGPENAIFWRANPLTLRTTFVSKAADALLGYGRSEWLNPELWSQCFHPEDRQRLLASLATPPDSQGELHVQHCMLTKGGRLLRGHTIIGFVQEPGRMLELDAVTLLIAESQDTQAPLRTALAEVEDLKRQLKEQNVLWHQKTHLIHSSHRLVGQSPAIRRVLGQVQQVAPTDSTVLLYGETGTGKELLALSIHELSARRTHAMVSVNCAAMPGTLVESEMFGREKGAFTGSLSRQIGRFELAHGSTIFLDEVGELSLETQSKLLRVIEAREIERLGNPRPIPVNVRIVAATNRDLERLVGEGKFRQDLYYRLNVFPITVPPLRERREDVQMLVWAFVDEFAKTFNKNVESLDRESLEALQRYSWPGNVRELRNVIERAMIVATGPKLRIQLPGGPAPTPNAADKKLEEVERDYMLRVLEHSGWRVRGAQGAAQALGLKPTTLEARMAKLGIHRPGIRSAAD